jgi:hypothetical protein
MIIKYWSRPSPQTNIKKSEYTGTGRRLVAPGINDFARFKSYFLQLPLDIVGFMCLSV